MRISSAQTSQFIDLHSGDFEAGGLRADPARGFAGADGLEGGSHVFVTTIPFVPFDDVTRLERSPGFDQLAPDIQARMREEVGRRPALLNAYQQMAASPSFRGLPQVIHLWAVYQVAKHVPPAPGGRASEDPIAGIAAEAAARNARQTLTDLVTRPGFAALAVEDQHRLLRYVGGIDNGIGGPARAELGRQLAETRERGASDAEVSRMLSEFVHFQHPTAWHPSPAAFPLGQPARPFTVSAPVTGPGEFGPSTFHTASIAGRSIRIVLPDPAPADAATANQIADALARLPIWALRATTEITLDPNPAMTDAARNGGNGKAIFYFGGWQPEKILETMVHEAAHFFSDTYNGDYHEGNGTQDRRWDPWVQAITSDALFPASYGKDNWRLKQRPGEDYAEALTLYWRVKGTPLEGQMRELFPARFAVLDQHTANDDLIAAVSVIVGKN